MLETKRLIIKPLTQSQLLKYIKLDNTLETEFGLPESSRTISPELLEALENTILPNVADTRKNYLFSTLWTIISKEENKMVGDLCFVGEPNDKGEVEIGYGTYPEFQGRGFMTDAVGILIQWAGKQSSVKAVVASTAKNNPASYSVLLKNNFKKTGETDELYQWQFDYNKLV